MKSRILPMVFCAAFLSACGGGGSGGGGDAVEALSCNYITGGSTSTVETVACATCSVEDAERAIDGDPSTYARLLLPALSNGSVALRAMAQSGVIYPAGSAAGAILSSVSTGSEYFSNGEELRPYYMNAPLGSNNVGSVNVVGGGGDDSPQRVYVNTLTMFDSIELAYTRGGSLGETEIRVHEFCAD